MLREYIDRIRHVRSRIVSLRLSDLTRAASERQFRSGGQRVKDSLFAAHVGGFRSRSPGEALGQLAREEFAVDARAARRQVHLINEAHLIDSIHRAKIEEAHALCLYDALNLRVKRVPSPQGHGDKGAALVMAAWEADQSWRA